ncbi:hypothetical protein PSQ40_04800 [Curvibacter sp. HBC61]|uniref:Uncharacterized protein n=1 Tax=Curvibacter cyanobacteriorum TaxID=3026422 RepID=A0ABT5MV14_9BURK|nr:hypothetical protein [Curvibacter sp. HBC61]MDD0837884.1 hypothetical protein [Curvibacter sp. HBC61]
MTITPIARMSPEDIADQAQAAADNLIPAEQANPFEPGSVQHRAYLVAYRTRQNWLESAKCS